MNLNEDKILIGDPNARWLGDDGDEAREKVIAFIKANLATGIIDFVKLSLSDKFGIIDGKRNLVGINLTKQEFTGCEIKNCLFNDADFSSCHFDNVTITNTILDSCNFTSSHFSSVEISPTSTISEATFENADITNLSGLSDKTMKIPIRYSRVLYRTILLKTVFKVFFGLFKEDRDYDSWTHTKFKDVYTDNLNSSANKEIKEHINWYQHLMNQFDGYTKRKWYYKISFITCILFTKYWSSYRALAFCAFFLNLIVSFVITLCPCLFAYKYANNIPFNGNFVGKWATDFYYCIVTFTTVGYGDVTPNNLGAQCTTVFVAVSGYVILGTLIYLISRKADKKF